MGKVLSELRRRNVFRVAGVYAMVGWLLMQLSAQLEGSLNLPSWFDTFVTVLVLIGFPIALVLAWAFEMTPEGMKPTKTVAPEDSIRDKTGRRLDIAILVGLVVLAGLTIGNMVGLPKSSDNLAPTAATISAADKSIAVLPFEAMSAEQSDMFLGRAIAEETLNRLAKIQELKVSARTSAFALADSDMDVKQIGAQLGVAHILEGSVRRSGDKIRITAQLIRTIDGFHIWTETFEPEMADLFLVEDRIVEEISRTLQIRLGVGIGSDKASSENIDPQAYETYLNGLALWSLRMRNDQNRMLAFRAFEHAAELDPKFAEAWSAIVNVGIGSVGSPLARNKEAFSEKIDNAMVRSLELDPDNVNALSSAARWRLTEHLDFDGARALLEKAYEIDPNQAEIGYASYWALTGEPEKALEALDNFAELDPLNYGFLRMRADFQAVIGRHDDASKFYNECQAKNCLREGFIAFGTTVALISNDPDELNKWKPLWKEFHAFIQTLPQSELPQVVKVIPAYYATEFGDPEAEQLQSDMIKLFETAPVTDTIGQWGPTFARFMPPDLFMDALELAYERGDLFGASFDLLPFYGQNNYPDELLMHPRYHTLWSKPGLKELAALRRTNGFTDGLPLPVVGDEE